MFADFYVYSKMASAFSETLRRKIRRNASGAFVYKVGVIMVDDEKNG